MRENPDDRSEGSGVTRDRIKNLLELLEKNKGEIDEANKKMGSINSEESFQDIKETPTTIPKNPLHREAPSLSLPVLSASPHYYPNRSVKSCGESSMHNENIRFEKGWPGEPSITFRLNKEKREKAIHALLMESGNVSKPKQVERNNTSDDDARIKSLPKYCEEPEKCRKIRLSDVETVIPDALNRLEMLESTLFHNSLKDLAPG